jgi:hypothetical protein
MSEGAGMLHARGCCPLKGELVSGHRILSRDNWSLFTVQNCNIPNFGQIFENYSHMKSWHSFHAFASIHYSMCKLFELCLPFYVKSLFVAYQTKGKICKIQKVI